MNRPTASHFCRNTVRALILVLPCAVAGCSGPERHVDAAGTVTYARPATDVLVTAVAGVLGIAIAAFVVRKNSRHAGVALLGLVVCGYLLASIPAQMAQGVSIRDSGLEWTVMSWLTWTRHELQWSDVERVVVDVRRGEKLIPGERGTPSKRVALRFIFADGRVQEWNDNVGSSWKDALDEVCEKAEGLGIPVEWRRDD